MSPPPVPLQGPPQGPRHPPQAGHPDDRSTGRRPETGTGGGADRNGDSGRGSGGGSGGGSGAEIEHLIRCLARLPGLGPRSARRAALALLQRRAALLEPLRDALAAVAERVVACSVCGALDTRDPCGLCRDPRRDPALLCVVRDVADLWALERAGAFRGRYHVLGGLLSALDGVGPEDLGLDRLETRARTGTITEVILALPATVDGQTTAHVIADRLEPLGITVSGLARGVPLGGDLDYLDDGTLSAAFAARRPLA